MKHCYCIPANYVQGHGAAKKITQSEPRSTFLTAQFGSHMVGTMNFEVSRNLWFRATRDLHATKAGFWDRKGHIIPVEFFLCGLRLGSQEAMCWAVKWRPVESGKSVVVEIYSRRPIPDTFKGMVDLWVYDRWTPSETMQWVPKYKKWFQSFPWGPQRADNDLVWSKIHNMVKWHGKSVLDIGCNTGWYSFMLNKYGAAVDGVDVNPKTLEVAREIGRHIEMSDVNFHQEDPGGNYDIILYLSVHHQVDPTYDKLQRTIQQLKKRCGVLVVELIVPPPAANMPSPEVHEKLGQEPVFTYEHAVRCTRSLYILKGNR